MIKPAMSVSIVRNTVDGVLKPIQVIIDNEVYHADYMASRLLTNTYDETGRGIFGNDSQPMFKRGSSVVTVTFPVPLYDYSPDYGDIVQERVKLVLDALEANECKLSESWKFTVSC